MLIKLESFDVDNFNCIILFTVITDHVSNFPYVFKHFQTPIFTRIFVFQLTYNADASLVIN